MYRETGFRSRVGRYEVELGFSFGGDFISANKYYSRIVEKILEIN